MAKMYESDPESENESDSQSEEEESDPQSEEEESDPQSEEEESDPQSEEDKAVSEDETRSDGDLRKDIWLTLQTLKTPTAFAVSAVNSSLPNPGIHLPRHGVLGLPLSANDAQKIISQARQSPFGKGEETIIDTSVRKSWELNPNQFSLKNPEWNKTMETIVDTVSTGLGMKKGMGKVSAELYKLLLYEPGAFFKPHKDSEKAPGMFATLVVCLPSPHKGGKLIMKHDNEKYEFETAGSSGFCTSYAAWFADVTHEVLPITSGYRLMLTYNLILQTNSDSVIPSYDLVRDRVQQLSMLLEQYDSWLKEGDRELPPILLHRLKHKYTQASLQRKLLKPRDRAQVQMLTQLSTKLGFDIYLATLELKVRTDEEYDDFEEKEQSLHNIVELDGKLVVESCKYPYGALIDSKPQDAREADEEENEGPTGNEGCPVTHWYRDTVVVLVPPSKQLDFVFEFGSKNKVIEPLFRKLMQKFSEDSAQKLKLEQLCELALKQEPFERQGYYGNYSETIRPYYQEAAGTALDLGRFDLFDEACKKTGDKILTNNAGALGCWAAKNGVAAVKDQLMKGLQLASSVAEKIKFMESIAKGFEAVVQEPGSVERLSLKQWSDEAIFATVSHLSTLTRADGTSLGQLCKTMDWNVFESKATPVILKAVTVVKITFINEVMSTLQQELVEKQRSFIEMIIRNIWNDLVFNFTQQGSKPQGKSSEVSKDDLNKNDVLRIVENTITILSSEAVETTIIPAMLTAIPKASKDCAKELFIPLVQTILKNELVGFKLSNDLVPPSSQKRLVQAFLIKFLVENVGLEPRAPTRWSLPAGPCNCSDCSVVNRFLQDPRQRTLDFPCAEHRRRHLSEKFTKWGKPNLDYKVETVRQGSPHIWRITKHRGRYETAKSEWMKNTEIAKQTLAKLKNDEPVGDQLQVYLQPYYSIIMNASVKELPDLKSLVSTAQLSENRENAAPTHQTGYKRGVSEVDLPEDGLTKRTKS